MSLDAIVAAAPLPLEYEHRQRGNVLIKMDVENEEWRIFSTLRDETFRSFRQLTFELHGVSNDGWVCRRVRPSTRLECWRGVRNVSETVALLERLDEHFVLVSHHGNNWWGAHAIAGVTVPDLMELTYINRRALPHGFACAPLPVSQINLLHKPNKQGPPEIDTLAPWSGAPQGFGVARGDAAERPSHGSQESDGYFRPELALARH